VNTFWWVLAGAAAGLAPWSVAVLFGWYYRVGGSWFEREVRRVRAAMPDPDAMYRADGPRS